MQFPIPSPLKTDDILSYICLCLFFVICHRFMLVTELTCFDKDPPCATCTGFIFLLSSCAGHKQKTFGLQRELTYIGFFRLLSVQQMEANKQVYASSTWAEIRLGFRLVSIVAGRKTQRLPNQNNKIDYTGCFAVSYL